MDPSLPQLLVQLQDAHMKEAARARAASPFSTQRPAEDPYGGTADQTQPTSTLFHGVVQQVIPYLGFYTVAPFGGGSAYICRLASNTGTFPFSGRAIGGPQPGDRVWFTVSRFGYYGNILAIDPGFVIGADPFIHEYLTQASPIAPASDRLLMSHILAKHELADYSNGGLLDATGFERGFMFPTGTGLFADPFMAGLRADENCGLWAFLYDRLLRLHGHNLQIRSACYGGEFLNDKGETQGIEGYSPYAWEALGQFSKAAAGQINSATVTQLTSPHLAGAEPLDQYQIPFRRLTDYTGYLGQGFRRILALPPSLSGSFKSGGQQQLIGVFQEHLSSAGDYMMASARGAMFYHVPTFSVPVPEKRPEDPRGAAGGLSADDKIAAGVGGEAPEGAAAGQRALDDLAYHFNWTAQHPFHYKRDDWYTPAPSKAVAAKSAADTIPSATLRPVDHRYSAPYVPTIAGYGFQPDGTFIVTGNGGEELIIGNGRIVMRAKEVLIESGGDIIQLAGRDHVTRAYRSAETAAATGDLRLKAEKKLEILGVDGLLLESRSTNSMLDFTKIGTDAIFGGIVIRSAGDIVQVGSSLYQRSESGNVVIDAAKGKADIVTNSASFYRYLSAVASDQFDKTTHEYRADAVTIAGSVRIDGDLTTTGSAILKDQLVIASGHIATSVAKQYDGKVVQLSNQGLVSARFATDAVGKAAEDANKSATTAKGSLTDYYKTNAAGNDEVIKDMKFSFRSTEQCESKGFKLFESRWAMQARLSGLSSATWTEPAVTVAGHDTYPFPGESVWTGNETFVQRDPALFDVPSGYAKAPGADYETAKYAEPVNKALQSNYPRS